MDSHPKYIYKIVPTDPPLPTVLPSALPVSELDQRDGYIHMSTSKQVLGTLKKFYADHQSVHILRVPYERVGDVVKWEAARPGEGDFPHIYNGLKLGKDEVDIVGLWKRGDGWQQGGGELEGWDKEEMS